MLTVVVVTIRFIVWLVSGYDQVFVLLSVVTELDPREWYFNQMIRQLIDEH